MSALGGTEFLVLQVGLAIFVSMLFGAIFEKLKQSAIIGYILGGILLGPQVFGFIADTEVLQLFSELGILILMFYIGLELDLKKLKEAGFTPFILGPAKMIICFALGYFAAKFFGFNLLESVLLGLVVSMSSTAIIGKYLVDNNLTKSLETSISIPMLLVEDFVAVVILALLVAVGGQHSQINQIVLNSLFFVIACIFVIANYSKLFIKLMENFSYEKHLALYSVGIALVMAFGAKFFGLSPAIGAFFAGFLLSELRHSEKIKRELETFRDFFTAFFFIAIGLAFAVPTTFGQISSTLIIGMTILTVYIFGEILVYGILGKFLGLQLDFSIYLANLMIPIGEFSLLIAGVAIALNVPHKADIVNLAIFLTASSAFVTPYFIRLSPKIANFFRAIIPKKLDSRIALLQSHFSAISVKIFENTSTQKELFDGIRRIGVNLFAIFASIYLTLFAQLTFTEKIFEGIPNTLIFSVLGAFAVFPVFLNIVREIEKIVKGVVSVSAPTIFSNLSLNQLNKISKSISDIFVGLFFLLMAILSLVVTNFLDVIYAQIPIALLAFALFFILRGIINSYRQSKVNVCIGIDSMTIFGMAKESK